MAEGSWPLEFKWLYNGTELTRFSLEYRWHFPSSHCCMSVSATKSTCGPVDILKMHFRTGSFICALFSYFIWFFWVMNIQSTMSHLKWCIAFNNILHFVVEIVMVMENQINFDIYTKEYFSILLKKWHFKVKSENSFVWLMFPKYNNINIIILFIIWQNYSFSAKLQLWWTIKILLFIVNYHIWRLNVWV